MLQLDGTSVGDAGLSHLGGLQAMQSLSLAGLPLSNAGLAHVGQLAGLRELYLTGAAGFGAGGLAHVVRFIAIGLGIYRAPEGFDADVSCLRSACLVGLAIEQAQQ